MPSILYAEDDRDCRELFALVLRQRDYRVHEAINGAQAVQIVREEAIDLAILDVRMPMMTGYEAARMIWKEAPHIPIIFLSVKGLQREVQKAFDCGPMVVDYLLNTVNLQAQFSFPTRIHGIAAGASSADARVAGRQSAAKTGGGSDHPFRQYITGTRRFQARNGDARLLLTLLRHGLSESLSSKTCIVLSELYRAAGQFRPQRIFHPDPQFNLHPAAP